MISLYGLNEQEWLNLAVFCSDDELRYIPMLELKAKYHNHKVQANVTATEAYIKQYCMKLKIHNEITSLGGKL